MNKNLLTALYDTCVMNKADFAKISNMESLLDDGRQLLFQNNNANILGVAHLDSVLTSRPRIRKSRKSNWICECPQLDDRLGVWVLLYVLKKININIDILLTDDEEKGMSTAQLFLPPEDKKYNWIFEFDRRGTDVVMYQFDTPKLSKMLKENGFRVGCGSFSDIADLDHLEISGFNFGTGYYNEHTRQCHANLTHTIDMVNKFSSFYKKYKDVKFPYEYSPQRQYRGYNYGNWWRNDYNTQIAQHKRGNRRGYYESFDEYIIDRRKEEEEEYWASPIKHCEICGDYVKNLIILEGVVVCSKCHGAFSITTKDTNEKEEKEEEYYDEYKNWSHSVDWSSGF